MGKLKHSLKPCIVLAVYIFMHVHDMFYHLFCEGRYLADVKE